MMVCCMSTLRPCVISDEGDPARFQVITGAGNPVAVHVSVALLPSRTVTGDGWPTIAAGTEQNKLSSPLLSIYAPSVEPLYNLDRMGKNKVSS